MAFKRIYFSIDLHSVHTIWQLNIKYNTIDLTSYLWDKIFNSKIH